MSMHSDDPQWIPSPWLDDIEDEMVAILSATLHALAMACEDRYSQQLLRYYNSLEPPLDDPRRPWFRHPANPDGESSHETAESRLADFNARQLDLFRPETVWDEEF